MIGALAPKSGCSQGCRSIKTDARLIDFVGASDKDTREETAAWDERFVSVVSAHRVDCVIAK